MTSSFCLHVASRKIFGGLGQIMEGQNFFVYFDEYEGIKRLYRSTMV